MLDNDMLSLHELSDLENEFDNQTISYMSNHKFNDQELAGILEDTINEGRDMPVRVSFAEFELTATDALALAF